MELRVAILCFNQKKVYRFLSTKFLIKITIFIIICSAYLSLWCLQDRQVSTGLIRPGMRKQVFPSSVAYLWPAREQRQDADPKLLTMSFTLMVAPFHWVHLSHLAFNLSCFQNLMWNGEAGVPAGASRDKSGLQSSIITQAPSGCK